MRGRSWKDSHFVAGSPTSIVATYIPPVLFRGVSGDLFTVRDCHRWPRLTRFLKCSLSLLIKSGARLMCLEMGTVMRESRATDGSATTLVASATKGANPATRSLSMTSVGKGSQPTTQTNGSCEYCSYKLSHKPF